MFSDLLLRPGYLCPQASPANPTSFCLELSETFHGPLTRRFEHKTILGVRTPCSLYSVPHSSHRPWERHH